MADDDSWMEGGQREYIGEESGAEAQAGAAEVEWMDRNEAEVAVDMAAAEAARASEMMAEDMMSATGEAAGGTAAEPGLGDLGEWTVNESE